MIKEREPCNISMRRIYFEDKLQELFGWKHGAYRKSTPDGYWGRCSNMAALGWSETNPYIEYMVNPLNHFRGV